MKEISISDDNIKKAAKVVKDTHNWCKIYSLGGEYELEQYLAVFTDDYRIVYEANANRIRLMLTEDQKELWSKGDVVDNENTILCILNYHDRGPWKEIG